MWGSCPQLEQETMSDSSPALIGCCDSGGADSSKWPWGSRRRQRSMIFFTDYQSHVILSGHSESFSKYD